MKVNQPDRLGSTHVWSIKILNFFIPLISNYISVGSQLGTRLTTKVPSQTTHSPRLVLAEPLTPVTVEATVTTVGPRQRLEPTTRVATARAEVAMAGAPEVEEVVVTEEEPVEATVVPVAEATADPLEAGATVQEVVVMEATKEVAEATIKAEVVTEASLPTSYIDNKLLLLNFLVL